MTTLYAIEAAAPLGGLPAEAATEFLELRHQTRTTLQRVLLQVLRASEFHRNCERRDIADDIARRTELSAEICDALFGFTHGEEPFPARLKRLSESLIAAHSDAAQMIHLELIIEEDTLLSRRREDAVLRIVHELVANALQHGTYMRLIGRIQIRLGHEADGTMCLSVANDGWHMDPSAVPGEGFRIVRALAAGEGGDVQVKVRPRTSIEVRLLSENLRPRALREG
jgi:two-component sensor histidine kinase